MQTISQVDVNESSLDTRCGLIHSISQMQIVDTLFDVKLAFSSLDVKKSGNLDTTDDLLTEDFVERAQFRLWTSARSPAERFVGLS